MGRPRPPPRNIIAECTAVRSEMEESSVVAGGDITLITRCSNERKPPKYTIVLTSRARSHAAAVKTLTDGKLGSDFDLHEANNKKVASENTKYVTLQVAMAWRVAVPELFVDISLAVQ